jgi:hypothetical protein
VAKIYDVTDMRLLIVEDELGIVDALTDDLAGILGAGEITVCLSRNSALEAIDSTVFDYAILDLKLPTRDEQLDPEIEHGKAVYLQLHSVSPGTPVCFLTAFPTDDFITDLLDEAEHPDVWGSGKQVPMVRMLKKGRLDEVAGLIRSVKEEIVATDDTEIIANPMVTFPGDRVLRIFGRRNKAATLVVSELSGGLSGAQVLRVEIRDGNGKLRLTAAARIGSRTEILKELECYKREVIRLPNGTFSGHIGEVMAGAGDAAGAFYRLIPNYETLAAILQKDPERASKIVSRLEAVEHIWNESRQQSSRTVGDIRRSLVSDSDMRIIGGLVGGLDWESFEERKFQAWTCSQHGDLHCGNVIVGPYNAPILIDFAQVGEAAASLDAITMELSLLFHPASRVKSAAWPTVNHAEHWDQIEEFVNGCPAASFIRAVREWSNRVAAGPREVYATTYALALRQLKYPDTDKDLARAILKAVVGGFR